MPILKLDIDTRPYLPNPLNGKVLQCLFLLLLLLAPTLLSAQYSSSYRPKTTRILFVLDGSGSMKEQWEGKTKFELARQLLVKMVDSIHRADPTIETGIRVFGHQYPKSAKNCKDSKLEIPFSEKSTTKIDSFLSKVEPKGYTPIAYSIYQSAEDFPDDKTAKNVIILITDGIETCDGDICAAGRMLQEKRISLKPFIIGLGLKLAEQKQFDCVGTFFDATNETGFKEALDRAVSQSLGNTTAQINLLNQDGRPYETNIEITLYDSYSGKLIYDFVHALNDAGNPDTLLLDPIGKYDIIAHTIPPVEKKGIELKPGIHNIIELNTPQGILNLMESPSDRTNSNMQCMVYRTGTAQTLHMQYFGSSQKYISGTYDLEVLSLPRLRFEKVQINQGKPKDIVVPEPGTLSLLFLPKATGGIYRTTEGRIELVYELGKIPPKILLDLLPGKYTLIYSLDNSNSSAETQKEDFYITSGNITTLKK